MVVNKHCSSTIWTLFWEERINFEKAHKGTHWNQLDKRFQKDKDKVAVETEWDNRAKQMIGRVQQGQFEADTHKDVEQNGNNSLQMVGF